MMTETCVSFSTENDAVQRLYDEAEAKCRLNLRQFGGDTVLVEGGGYEKIWLETQPMGGEMYALRNMAAAVNNCMLFMRYQRSDGRMPGSIQCKNGVIEPQFNKYQGFCFPWPALNLYYLMGEDRHYLQQLADCLRRFDDCLWRTRDSNGDGLLESFCVYDTGEDLALRYGDAPCWWTEDTPPAGYQVVPMASMDVMSWSYACRDTLAHISRILGDGQAENWHKKAVRVANAIKTHLWDDKKKACYDRDKTGNPMEILCHNTLRCMHWGSIDAGMAKAFVEKHLLNPAEFWTPFPLPSVAANDPAFRNAPENNWSGQPEGLTYQRAILALEKYGYHKIVTMLGDKLMHAVIHGGYRFTQQFDPFTGKPSLVHAITHQPLQSPDEPCQDAYGPTLLSVLEYIGHRWGIDMNLDQVWFSLGSGWECQYGAAIAGHRYQIKNDGKTAEIFADGRRVLRCECGVRVIADRLGNVIDVVDIE